MNLNKNQKYILKLLLNFEIASSLKLSKLIYLLQSLGADVEYNYKRGDFGPVSSDFFSDLKMLEDFCLISKDFDFKGKCNKYNISKQGKFLIGASELSIKEMSFIQYWNSLSKDQSIRILYKLCNVSEYEIGDHMPLVHQDKILTTFFTEN